MPMSERTASSVEHEGIHGLAKEILLAILTPDTDATVGDLRAPTSVGFYGQDTRAVVTEMVEHAAANVPDTNEADCRPLDRNLEATQHPPQDLIVPLRGKHGRISDDASREPTIQIIERCRLAIGHDPVPEILAGRDVYPRCRCAIIQAGDREVEQSEITRATNAGIRRGEENALATNDPIEVALRERSTDPEQPRPVDFLFHSHRELD